MFKVLKYSFYDLSRSRWTYAYLLFFLLVTFGLIWFSNDLAKTIISLMNVVLIICPLIATLFGALYYYNSREFIDLLLALPLPRRAVFLGKYLGLSISLAGSFVIGISLPFLVFGVYATDLAGDFLVLLSVGVLLTFVFSALSFLVAIRFENPIKGFGAAIFVWLFLAVIYDGILLLLLMFFEQYPLDRFALISTIFNPVDLSRVLIMLRLDISALMGYTGAVFRKFLGTSSGIMIAYGALLLWIIVPAALFIRLAGKKDF